MDLKDFLGKKDDLKKDLYWAVVLESGWVQAGIWEIVDGKAKVVSISPATIWENESELIGASDAALSSAVQLISEKITEPSKTVFGVPPSWVDKGQIKEEYLSKIKNICNELSLEPSGFVVLSEAITHLIKIEEGSPVNAIIISFDKDFIELSVFKLGNLIGTTQVARSVSFFDDTLEGLSRFSLADNLPSRIILYDGKEGELEEIKELLITSNWEGNEKVKFLHTPKVETLSPDKKVIAVSLAGASEIAGVSEIVDEKKEEILEEIHEEMVSKDHDNLSKPVQDLSAQELGFVVGEDVASKEVNQERTAVDSISSDIRSSDNRIEISQNQPVYKPRLFDILKRKFNFKIKTKVNFPVIGIILGVVVSLLLFFWLALPKANIKIYVSPKKFEEKVNITILKGSGTDDLSNNVVVGQVVNTQVTGEKTKSATGNKKVGEKSKGSVKIQNGTSSILKLSSGTLISSANGLKFSLDNSASVSAALSPSNPGTYVVEVIASDIGAEYNLAKNEIFSVGNLSKSEVDAISVSDFTGGSSREILAVSSDDANSLLEGLTSELSQNAKSDLMSKISESEFLIEDSLTATPSSKIFSNKIGDEASNLKLSLTLKTSALSILKDKLTTLSEKVISGIANSEYYLDSNNLNFNFKRIKDLSSASTFDLTIKASFLPKEDLTLLVKDIAGKSASFVEGRLSDIPGFVRAEINVKPKLPQFLGALPKLKKNISIEIIGEK